MLGVRNVELVLLGRVCCSVESLFLFQSTEFLGVCLGELVGDGFGVAFVLNGLNVKLSPLIGRGLLGTVPLTTDLLVLEIFTDGSSSDCWGGRDGSFLSPRPIFSFSFLVLNFFSLATDTWKSFILVLISSKSLRRSEYISNGGLKPLEFLTVDGRNIK